MDFSNAFSKNIYSNLLVKSNSLALRFNFNVSFELLNALSCRGELLEFGALVLPLRLSHGKDMFYGEPVYSNEDYKIRGYGNIHREDGEYTYCDEAILSYPWVIPAKEFNEYGYEASVTDINKEDYAESYCACGFVKFLNNGVEEIIYSDTVQASLYGVCLAAVKDLPDNKLINEVIKYCEEEREALYVQKEFGARGLLPCFVSKNIEGLKIERLRNKMVVSEYSINWYGNGSSTDIVHVTDAHLNYVNSVDYAEVNPAIMSTAERRIWCCDGQTVPFVLKAMEYASFSDKIVLTGDMMDYNSKGCLQLAERVMFKNATNSSKHSNKFSKVVATLGNHEPVKQMEGIVKDTATLSENYEWLQKHWPNDISYHSEVVKNKNGDNPVKIILLDNQNCCYLNEKIPEKLEEDITCARKSNMPILIFQHTPLFDGTYEVLNGLFNPILKLRNSYLCAGSPNTDQLTLKVYNLITENADIIRGVFCGHQHEYFYSEIKGRGKSSNYTIPQHIYQSVAYGEGYVLKISVK